MTDRHQRTDLDPLHEIDMRLRGSNIEGCEGDCNTHKGRVRCVRVVDKDIGHNWGCFWYCDEAVHEDKRRGLTVTEV